MDQAGLGALRRRLHARLRVQGLREDLRQRYLELILPRNRSHTDHIRRQSDWFFYVFFTRLIAELLPDRRARLVDWGGFYGQVTRLLRDLGYSRAVNYLLHEPPAWPVFAQALDLPVIWGRDPNRLNLASASVDGLISSGVLEHVGEDGQGDERLIMREIERVLKPGGLCLIWNLPARWSLSELAAQALGRWRHERRFSLAQARELVQSAGLKLLCWDRHKLLPGSLLERFCRLASVVAIMQADDRLSHLPLFRLLARDFLLVAAKPS